MRNPDVTMMIISSMDDQIIRFLSRLETYGNRAVASKGQYRLTFVKSAPLKTVKTHVSYKT